jgi:hypothetical protein
MSAPWNFQQNCLTTIYYNVGFSAPPSGSPTYTDVPTQQMKPWGHSASLSLTFWHRLIIPLAPVTPILSNDLYTGTWVKLYDTGGVEFRWLIVNDVSPLPFDSGGGVFQIAYQMLMCRPFIGPDTP